MLFITGRMSQREAPLYRAAKNYLQKKYTPLHVPLHGRGGTFLLSWQRDFFCHLQWDLTELPPLDDLHLPRGVIAKAQKLAASLFRADISFFLVNGVTGGMLALFLGVCQPGDKVLISRLSHKSVHTGIILSGARPVYLPVEREPLSGFPLNLSPTLVERAVKEHPDARLLLVTSPSYWGVTCDLEAIRKITEDYGMLLAVDEAHGTYLPFMEDKLPHSAKTGADIWLHSAHKSLGAITAGGFLHLRDNSLREKVAFWLQAVQSSSPSYPVMISLDLARRRAALHGKELFGGLWEWALHLRNVLTRKGVPHLSVKAVNRCGFKLDPARFTFFSPGGNARSFAVELAKKYRVQVEMTGDSYLLAVAGPAVLNTPPSFLGNAFSRVLKKDNILSRTTSRGFCHTDFPLPFFSGDLRRPDDAEKKVFSFVPQALSPRDALHLPYQKVPLVKAGGKTCGEMVILSPPGIPLVSPGERITADIITFLQHKCAAGWLFQGVSDPWLQKIKVIYEE